MSKPGNAVVSAFQVSVKGETSTLPAGASTSARWFNESHVRRSRPGTSAGGLTYVGVHEAPGGRWLNESFLELSQSAGTRFRKNQPFRLRCARSGMPRRVSSARLTSPSGAAQV